MKIKVLSINHNYKIHSDGKLWSIQRGKFVKPSRHSKAKPNFYQYDIFNFKTGKRQKIAKHRLAEFEFGSHGKSKVEFLERMKINIDALPT